jgi:hypothetical protein
MTYNDLTIEEIEKLITDLVSVKEIKLKNQGFPYLDIFKLYTNSGEEIEKMLSKTIFHGLYRVTNESHDHKTLISEKNGETKLIRMMVKGEGTYEKRAISILDKNRGYNPITKKYGGKISTTTFQQIKPTKFDFIVCVLLYKDGMDIFILPSNKISNKVKIKEDGLAYLSGQHEGNHEEGQLSYNDKVLSKHYVFSIYNDGDCLYYFDRSNKKIGDKFNKQNIEDVINEKFGI